MKLLHTSDWHLGAKLGRHDRLEDHLAALRGLIECAEEQQPDLIVHSGDLFDSARPAYRPLQAGIKALRRLTEIAPTVVLAGNHDSGQLLRILDELASMAGARRLRLVTRPEVVTIEGLDDVALAAVPFVTPSTVVNYATEDIARLEGSYADKVRALNDHLLAEAEDAAGDGGIVLYAAHLHVHGASPGRSERRITVGEDYATHIEGLHRALYCAFGHIHDPQLLPGGQATGRYAGSLIPIDFGEATQTKQTVVVDLSGQTPTIEEYPLPGGRPLTQFTGSLDEFDAAAADGGFDGQIVKARVTSENPVTDLADRLLEASPDCHVFDLTNEVTSRPVKPITDKDPDLGEPDLATLFTEWQEIAGPDRAPASAVSETVAAALEDHDNAATVLAGTVAQDATEALQALPARHQQREA